MLNAVAEAADVANALAKEAEQHAAGDAAHAAAMVAAANDVAAGGRAPGRGSTTPTERAPRAVEEHGDEDRREDDGVDEGMPEGLLDGGADGGGGADRIGAPEVRGMPVSELLELVEEVQNAGIALSEVLTGDAVASVKELLRGAAVEQRQHAEGTAPRAPFY